MPERCPECKKFVKRGSVCKPCSKKNVGESETLKCSTCNKNTGTNLKTCQRCLDIKKKSYEKNAKSEFCRTKIINERYEAQCILEEIYNKIFLEYEEDKRTHNVAIYKITNTVNNLEYIGQTKQTLKKRFSRHRCDRTRTNLYVLRDLIGFNKFKIEEIDRIRTNERKNVDDLEYYHIHQSYKKGVCLNHNFGAIHPYHCRVYDKSVKSYPSDDEIARNKNYVKSVIDILKA